MRLQTCAIFLAVGVAFLTPSAKADDPQFADGRYLLERCTSKDNVDVGYCLGYVAGAGDAYTIKASVETVPISARRRAQLSKPL
jgi:hypothetical protein